MRVCVCVGGCERERERELYANEVMKRSWHFSFEKYRPSLLYLRKGRNASSERERDRQTDNLRAGHMTAIFDTISS